MAYQVLTVDLSGGADKKLIIDRNIAFDSLTVLQADAAAAFTLAIGDGPEIPFSQGMTWEGDPCAPENNGLSISADPQVGVIIKIYVAMGSSIFAAQ